VVLKNAMKKYWQYSFREHMMKKKGVLIMARTVCVSFRLDEDVKKSMEQVCSELGLSMSAAFTIFAKKVGREKRIPFDVSVDPFYSESNIRYLEQKMEDYKAGRIKTAEHKLIEE
jgi:DNA-damage-inducible protein J